MSKVLVLWVPAPNDNATAYVVTVAKANDPAVLGQANLAATDPHQVELGPFDPGDYVATVTPLNPAADPIVGASAPFSIPVPAKPVLLHPVSLTVTVVP